jgi:sugar diacid utilization regulator
MAEDLRGGVLEELRGEGAEIAEVVRRAAKVGCDLAQGAVVLAAEVRSGKPRFAAALITSEWPGAIAEPVGGERLLALLPGRPAPAATLDAARRISARLKQHGPAAFSSYCAEPGELRRAVREAELALEVVARDDRLADQLQDGVGEGVYRLLFRALASSPDEVRSFYEDTVEPLVEHDREYRTDLLGTLESYLANDCNTNATARAVFAHRHTVAHRLERIRELTGLDPSVGEDRERLGLGVKAYRILAPTLPR